MPEITTAEILDSHDEAIYNLTTKGTPPQGQLPLTDEMLRTWACGDLFGLTQNSGMGWPLKEMLGTQCLILGTMGGIPTP